jgi:AcrR family transcriptional regulator
MAGPKKGSTTARGRTRREQILEASLDAFAQQGFRGTSMASIAASVELTEPGLLHHFPSKVDLLLAILEHHERETRALLETASRDRSFPDGILELARRHEADPRFIRFFTTLTAESLDPHHPAHQWFVDRYRGVRRSAIERIEREQAAGRISADLPAAQLADMMIALFDGLQLQHLREPDAVRIVPGLARFFRLISPDDAAADRHST